MLNELEKNKQDDQVRQEALSGITPSIIKQKYTLDKKVIYLITIIVILIISIAIAWHYRTKATTNAPKTKPITTKEQPPLPAITLQSITLEQKDKRTNLDFILSAPTQYLIEHSTEQQLSITLNNTGLLGNLPVALENSFIITLNVL